MTGELCDCFASKQAGVRHIVRAARKALPDKTLLFWRNDARLVGFDEALDNPLPLAAANWLALACLAGRFAPKGSALVIDMGSTTTDIIPLVDGSPLPAGRTDLERLRSRELVYLGASRTPLCALLGSPYAAELFATTRDVYLALGLTPESPDDYATADGRPATRAATHARLARMLCADGDDLSHAATGRLAQKADSRLRHVLERAIGKVAGRLHPPVRSVILAGSGEFLAIRVGERMLAFSTPGRFPLKRGLGSCLPRHRRVLLARWLYWQRSSRFMITEAERPDAGVKVGGSLFDLEGFRGRLGQLFDNVAADDISCFFPESGPSQTPIRENGQNTPPW